MSFAGDPPVTDINIEVADGEKLTREISQCDVIRSGGVAMKRSFAVPGVVAPGCVKTERTTPVRTVVGTGSIKSEHVSPYSCVAATGGVSIQRSKSNGRVVEPLGIARHSIQTQIRVGIRRGSQRRKSHQSD